MNLELRGLHEVVAFLNSLPWPVRSSFKITFDDITLTIQRGGMIAFARMQKDGLVVVTYEHELHLVTRQTVPPAVAARVILTVIQRQHLEGVAIPKI